MLQFLTAAEADALLVPVSIYEDWDAAEDAVKDHHLQLASNYMFVSWLCPYIDWEDNTTLTDDIKLATARYADASLRGLLYPYDARTDGSTGAVVEVTDQVGSLRSTTRWDPNKNSFSDPDDFLRPIHAIMQGQECTMTSKAKGGTVELTRV